ncbi:hypothetical protein CsSME_00013360 [Camellia sinensis var. sinensis]
MAATTTTTTTTISTTHKWSISVAEDLKCLTPHCTFTERALVWTGKENEILAKQEEQLEEVRSVLRKVREEEDSLKRLVMIDALQRLGIDYHFREDIEAVLHSQYMKSSSHSFTYQHEDLYEVSTRFRLLRQQGHNVPTDVFDKFKDKDGRFKTELSEDIRGLMGLYEASQLSIEGEDILDQAADFSAQQLNGWLTRLDNHHQAKVISNTLGHPQHKSLAKFMAKNFLSDYNGPNANVLQELAKMDFNMSRSMYQKEMLQVSKWWKSTGLGNELKYARNQPLKWYLWSMATLTDPSLSEQRVELTKPISLVYIIDDIFDVYGTLEQLILFTEAVNRWELAAVNELPGYMKICFKVLQDSTNEISYGVHKKYGWNPIDSLRRTWAILCNAFLEEAKWFASGQLPKAEEYLKNGIVSSGVPAVLVHMFFLLGHGMNKESVDFTIDNPDIITSTATILRLWDDLGSAKDENQDGHDGSYVDCYMKENEGSTAETARKQVVDMISDAWKRLNRECLSPNRFSANFTQGCLNTARMVPLMYCYDDNHNLPILEEHMKSMFRDTVSL